MALNKNNYYITILIFTPFIYLFPHTLGFIEMGNDFELLYFSYKKYIFEFIKIGTFPLWSPSEGLGYSLIFNPFVQYFYPLSWLLYIIAYLIGDLSKQLYLLYTILGISIYNIGQYLWLKKLNIDIKYCFISTLIVCFGIKINEILRFPNAIHAFCWFPWLLYAMTTSLDSKYNLRSILIIFFSCLSIFLSGYPYYIFYGLIFFTSYLFFLTLPNIRNSFFLKNKFQGNLKFLSINLLTPLSAMLITVPWFLGIIDIMEITRDRNLNNIDFSSILNGSLLDHVGSIFYPPIAITEGNYYFGSIISLLILFYFINFFFDKNKTKFEVYFLLYFVILYLLIIHIGLAKDSFLFRYIWNKLDIIQNFRAFIRINILLLPLMAILIALSLRNILKIKEKKEFQLLLLTGFFILIVQIYFIEISNNINAYWDHWQARRLDVASNEIKFLSIIFKSYNNYIYPIFLILSLIVLINFKKLKNKNLLLFSFPLIAACELFLLVNIIWAIPKGYYDFNGYNNLSKTPIIDIKKGLLEKRVSTVVKGNTYFRNSRRYNINYFDNFGIDNHTKIFDTYFRRDGSYKKDISSDLKNKINFAFGLDNLGKKIFFTKKIYKQNFKEFINELYRENYNLNKISVTINEYNGNKLEIECLSENDGYLVFMDNWAPGWKVIVNNKNEILEKSMNTYKSVKISKGYNLVKFVYEPW
jgi:hypothetical protein